MNDSEDFLILFSCNMLIIIPIFVTGDTREMEIDFTKLKIEVDFK